MLYCSLPEESPGPYLIPRAQHSKEGGSNGVSAREELHRTASEAEQYTTVQFSVMYAEHREAYKGEQ